jgi:aspartyl-tRNA(Asn)/glutamyl-tRNA(Gln) amidotransferase subunit B
VQDFVVSPKMLAELVKIKPTIGSSIAKEVFAEMINTGKSAPAIVNEKDLTQMDDTGELNDIVIKIIEENPKAVEDYGLGKKNALAFLIGQTMKITKGKANPKILTELFTQRLSSISK